MRAFARHLVLSLTLVATAGGIAVAAAPPASAVVASQLTLSPAAKTVSYATTIRFAAHLAGPAGPLRNSQVSLWRRGSASTAWLRVVTLVTNDNGDAAYSRSMRSTGQWQARFGGSLVYDGAVTAARTITVLPPPAVVPFGQRVVTEAARHRGAPYQYGAAGPYRFDCSGFTRYVLSRFHVYLSHNAAAQYGEVHHVSRAYKRAGDLIFFRSSSGIYHVGIYAGSGRMWAAPHTGDHVRLESIYSASYVVGRVR